MAWRGVGPVSDQALYRFEQTDDGVLVNGWAGHVYKCTDDGRTWRDCGPVDDSPLYATEFIGAGVALQASDSGAVFRSTDNGDTWTQVAKLAGAADDFVSLGKGVVLYSTYTGRKHVYLSRDDGLNWTDAGRVPTGADDDVLDHVIAVKHKGRRIAIGGTKQGYLVRLFVEE